MVHAKWIMSLSLHQLLLLQRSAACHRRVDLRLLGKTPTPIKIKHTQAPITLSAVSSPALAALDIAIVECSRLPPPPAAHHPLLCLVQSK